jgi:hypothetical protein
MVYAPVPRERSGTPRISRPLPVGIAASRGETTVTSSVPSSNVASSMVSSRSSPSTSSRRSMPSRRMVVSSTVAPAAWVASAVNDSPSGPKAPPSVGSFGQFHSAVSGPLKGPSDVEYGTESGGPS